MKPTSVALAFLSSHRWYNKKTTRAEAEELLMKEVKIIKKKKFFSIRLVCASCCVLIEKLRQFLSQQFHLHYTKQMKLPDHYTSCCSALVLSLCPTSSLFLQNWGMCTCASKICCDLTHEMPRNHSVSSSLEFPAVKCFVKVYKWDVQVLPFVYSL